MGQNPVQPNPGMPQYPQSGPSGPSAPSFGQPPAPGYGYQGPRPGATPYGPPPGAGPAGPGPTYPYPPAPPLTYAGPAIPTTRRAPKKRRKGPLIGLVAGGVALVLVIAAVAAIFLTQKAAPASTEPDKVTKATAALQGYLQALAAGNADKAKQYAMNPTADSPLLTNDFLAASVAKNVITEIQVDPQNDSGTSAYLRASYKLGGTLVQGNYQLTKVAKLWRLNTVVTTVDRPTYWGTLGVTINGTVAPTSQLSFFPGVYQLGTGTSLLAFEQPAFTVNGPGDNVSGFSSTQPALTDAGKKAMITTSQAWLTQCLAVQDNNPKDCGMNTPLPDGATLASGSLKRVVDATAPFADATPRVSYDDPTKITLSSYVTVKVSAADTAGNTYSGSTSVTSAVGTIKGETITVVFTD
jgi:hypothetical protein